MTEMKIRSSGSAGPTTAELCLPPHLQKPRIRRWEASEYLLLAHGLVVAEATLAKYASIGGGPEFEKFGRAPLYRPRALDTWAEGKLAPVSTSTSRGV